MCDRHELNSYALVSRTGLGWRFDSGPLNGSRCGREDSMMQRDWAERGFTGFVSGGSLAGPGHLANVLHTIALPNQMPSRHGLPTHIQIGRHACGRRLAVC